MRIKPISLKTWKMRKVVSNTTPLIALSKISKTELLKSIYGEIIIAKGVFEEYESGKDKDFYTDLSGLKWIKIVEIKDKEALEYLIDLDKGEAESIVLANEIEADLLIIDELRGRELARLMGLNITGTIGVLLKAKEENLIQTALPFIFELIEKGIWINENLIQYVKEIAQE